MKEKYQTLGSHSLRLRRERRDQSQRDFAPETLLFESVPPSRHQVVKRAVESRENVNNSLDAAYPQGS